MIDISINGTVYTCSSVDIYPDITILSSGDISTNRVKVKLSNVSSIDGDKIPVYGGSTTLHLETAAVDIQETK